MLEGEVAAVTVSVLWSFASILFAFAGRRAGVLNLNAVRIAIAAGLLGSAHIALFGTLLPAANPEQWAVMGLSGIVGLALGDLAYFGCLVALGPRRGVLLLSTSPIFAAVAGFVALGEVLDGWTVLGVAVTIAGVAWVVLESEERADERALDPRRKTAGILLGVAGAACQGVGLVISKYGMVDAASDPASPLNPLSAALIRMAVAAVVVWAAMAVLRRFSSVVEAFRDRRALGAAFGGACFGPFLGVWLSMVAVTYAFAGVASTLMSLMPVIVIPIVWVLYRQRTTWRGFLGAAVAIAGTAILFLA